MMMCSKSTCDMIEPVSEPEMLCKVEGGADIFNLLYRITLSTCKVWIRRWSRRVKKTSTLSSTLQEEFALWLVDTAATWRKAVQLERYSQLHQKPLRRQPV